MVYSSSQTTTKNLLYEVAMRIRDLRDISGFSVEQMAEFTDTTKDDYLAYESGALDIPFTFIHKCALTFGVEITDIMEGRSAKLSSFTITRRGEGQITARERGIEIVNLAPNFRKKISEPYFVRYEYAEELQKKPIALTTHSGQEFDYIVSGCLKVQVGSNIAVLSEGDSIYYDSSTPHGMIAVDGKDCVFLAIVLPGEETEESAVAETIIGPKYTRPLIASDFIDVIEDERGSLKNISFKNEDKFNFAFDIVDGLASKSPDKLAMIYVDNDKNEQRFTFSDMKKSSSRAANYFKSLGISKGDRVLVVLKRHHQFWSVILGLHKLGAVAIPATNQLLEKDFEYRFNAAGVKAIICTGDGETAAEADKALINSPTVEHRILVKGSREGWRNFDEECAMFSSSFPRTEDSPCGNDTMIMLFTSGTTGYPKIAAHNYKYALGHFITAKYWHCVDPDGIHFTISDTGWGKALWGKLYGQWLCEAATFVYDFERFSANDILPMFSKYNITTFCAPPTMYRFFIKEDLSGYDLSSIKHATTAGEALNPEVVSQFRKATGLTIREGFGQTETTLSIATLAGMSPVIGSMGKPTPLYDVVLLDPDGLPVDIGETGEICIKTSEHVPCGLFSGYYMDQSATDGVWHDGFYHTGDTAWCDENGYFWYVGRADDIIKSSGYRIGPFEIESVIMELPYVLECGVTGAPDPIRGQVIKACIILTKDTKPDEKLKKEIQEYVKHRTAPYKYPRIVEFRESLPKTISGKIQRNKL